MARTASFYTDRATARFEAGFTSKAAQQEALRDLNSAFELLKRDITGLVLDIEHDARTADHDDVYWNLADYPHNWKAKHSALALRVFPQTAATVAQIEALVEFRAAVKAAPVVKAERKTDTAKIEAVTKSIRDLMERRQEQYNNALRLHDIFGGLPVHANVHYVTNQHGTTFLRAFYYLDGQLTPLGIIIAAAEAKAREAEGE